MNLAPGAVRDSIVTYLLSRDRPASLHEIYTGVLDQVGHVPESSVRSYLNNNTPGTFERTGRGTYQLSGNEPSNRSMPTGEVVGRGTVFHADCFDWLDAQEMNSVHAVLTDPPYGVVEYSGRENDKRKSGSGGVWRVPPSFDGHVRSPLPRFTTLGSSGTKDLLVFYERLGRLLRRVCVPGANVLVASNPLLMHLVTTALEAGGLEPRGAIVRQVMTMRGGDRPKNAHEEFDMVSVMPRSTWEPWICMRNPIEGRVQDNLRKWGTGGFKRQVNGPFTDQVKSSPTNRTEKAIAPHPSLKPQALMRHFTNSILPLDEGVILDPFMGAGSTVAAANYSGHRSIGIERDAEFFDMAVNSIPALSSLSI